MDKQTVYGSITGVLSNVRQLTYADKVTGQAKNYVEVEFENPAGFGRTSRYLYLSMSNELYETSKLNDPKVLSQYKDKLVTAPVAYSSRDGRLSVSVTNLFKLVNA